MRQWGQGPEPVSWRVIARNKHSVALDLRATEGQQLARQLIGKADILIENFRPGTLERWDLDPKTLCAENPKLIVVRISGYGQDGPYAQRAGFGTLAEAMSGFAAMTGAADGPPTLPSFGLADSICGIAASSAVMMAMRVRDRGDGGQIIDMNILEPILAAVGPAPMVYSQTGDIATRNGNRSTSNAPRNTYRTKDGSWVAVSTSAQRIAERVMELVGHPEVIDEPWFASGRGRVQHVDLLDGYLSEWIGSRDRDDVLAAFEKAGAAIAPIYDARNIVEDPHIRETEMLTEVDDPDLGPLLMHNVMWRLARTPGSIRFTGRALGADTDAVLAEIGYDAMELERMRAQGVIA
jgi:crotonobetainyl-CoA:carnitine CoA-transferase CaiB-like acyl-CoA transferase